MGAPHCRCWDTLLLDKLSHLNWEAYDEPIDSAVPYFQTTPARGPGVFDYQRVCQFHKSYQPPPKNQKYIPYIHLYPIIPLIHGDNSPIYPIHIPFILPSGKLTDIDPRISNFEWKRIFQADDCQGPTVNLLEGNYHYITIIYITIDVYNYYYITIIYIPWPS